MNRFSRGAAVLWMLLVNIFGDQHAMVRQAVRSFAEASNTGAGEGAGIAWTWW
jgi:hypothetical protein